jgi:hypothetical protein
MEITEVDAIRLTHCGPIAKRPCFECDLPWIERTCKKIEETEVVSLAPWIGQTLQTAVEAIIADTSKKKEYLSSFNLLVRNDRHIDRSPDPEFPELAVNKYGWSYNVSRDYVVQKGDDILLWVNTYYHHLCSKRRVERLYREQFEGIFKSAGVEATLTSIPNEYCPCDNCGPWFTAQMPFGTLKLGWRKRVINIDWSDTGLDLQDLFINESTTKGAHFIHAWGVKKAVEYLQLIVKHMPANNDLEVKRREILAIHYHNALLHTVKLQDALKKVVSLLGSPEATAQLSAFSVAKAALESTVSPPNPLANLYDQGFHTGHLFPEYMHLPMRPEDPYIEP